MQIHLRDVPHAFHLPRPNWDVVRAWVERHVDEPARSGVWADLVVQWLDILNEALDGAYQLERGDEVLLFSPRSAADGRLLLEYAEWVLDQVVDLLGGLASEALDGPLPVLLFEDPESYYTYVSQFYPEGEFGGTAGMCLRDGCLHIAVCPSHIDGVQITLAHEITHACLCRLDLPLWLEEGITQFAEQAFHSRSRGDLDPAQFANVRRHWREHGLQRFWWGEGFYSPGEEQDASYHLARALFQLAVADHRRTLPEFVRHASSADVGETAARRFLGCGLGEFAAKFLGTGDWQPVPPDAIRYARRGALFESRGELEKALADLNEALELDPRLPVALSTRGRVRHQLRQFAEAIADCEAAIACNPREVDSRSLMAWILATCPQEQHRDGERAVELATTACELTDFHSWTCITTLAAACAEAGDFESAQTWGRESLRLAPDEERARCKERLRLYKRETACRGEASPRWPNFPSVAHPPLAGKNADSDPLPKYPEGVSSDSPGSCREAVRTLGAQDIGRAYPEGVAQDPSA